jgi:hypothetical protein
MRFEAGGKYTQGVTDPDPVTAPESILEEHILVFGEDAREDPDKIILALLGTSTESVTLDLYTLIEDRGGLDTDKYIGSDKRWFKFATGVVVTNGTLAEVTSGLPAGGVVYARRTADTITSTQTRNLLARWV